MHRSSGQIDNRRCARIVALHSAGKIMTQQEISELCVASLAKVLRIAADKVKTDAKFSRLGLDSAMVVYVMLELEEKLGLELSTDDFYDYPTIDQLSRHLAERRAAAA